VRQLGSNSKRSSIGFLGKGEYTGGAEGMIRWCNENVYIPIYRQGDVIPTWCKMGNLPSGVVTKTGKSYDSIWVEQQKVLREALVLDESGFFKNKLLVFCWMRGEGKCQEKGSKVLMFDGSIKKVEDIVIGDLLMGDDNTSREVLSLVSGREEMFEVVPYRGESMVVTADHKLSLKRRRRGLHKRGKPINDTEAGKITDITVRDFQKQNKSFKNFNLLYRVPVNWPEQKVPIDPYFLGLWLGDGHSHVPSITTMDKEIVDYLYSFASKMNMQITVKWKGKGNKAKEYALVTDKGKGNPLLSLLRENNLLHNKHIPKEYKANSREVRLQVLAGLVDTDGYRNRNSIQFTLKDKLLCDDILFLARSLGFHANIKKCTKGIKSTGFSGEYYRIGISGDCSIIPSLIPRKKCLPRSKWKDVLVTTIKEIKSVGEREYFGFMLDGNGRYVTGDFTVTHNSLLAVLVQLWKFFCFPRQQIMLGANSKEQTKFVHYDIMRDIILNSPELLSALGGKKNVQEKEIRLRDDRGRITSVIRAISSFSGIRSNITGYTFSEIFDMKNPRFFVQLDGSLRNIPNALGVIDSTVSDKQHVLYSLFVDSIIEKKTKTVFFSYRCSKNADPGDYWNPHMDGDQLSDYKIKFPMGEFEKYFQNLWSAGITRVFSEEVIREKGIMGIKGEILNHEKIADAIRYESRLTDIISGMEEKEHEYGLNQARPKLVNLRDSLVPVSNFYKLQKWTQHDGTRMCSMAELNMLGDLLDTDFCILAGTDFGDPVAVRTYARSMGVVVAKCLPRSRKNFFVSDTAPNYLYLLLCVVHAEKNNLGAIKEALEECNKEYDGIDTLCSERFGSWDLSEWCEERAIEFDPIFPTYDRQREGFNNLYNIFKFGLFKSPPTDLPGNKRSDILDEELEVFDHDSSKRWFGSPEKYEKNGAQDDTVYALNWCIFGGRKKSVNDFRIRRSSVSFGEIVGNSSLLGRY